MGIPPTGKQVAQNGVTIYRLAGGRIVDGRLQADDLGLMQQLGVIPVPEAAASGPDLR